MVLNKSGQSERISKRPEVTKQRTTRMKVWREKNKEKICKYKKEYEHRRCIEDPGYKLRVNLRKRIAIAIKYNQKSGSAIKDLGCSIPELKKYIEAKWLPGMTWNNWSRKGWHLDHIKPLSHFDLTNREQFLQACNYTNLQPLWWLDNIKKNNHYNYS